MIQNSEVLQRSTASNNINYPYPKQATRFNSQATTCWLHLTVQKALMGWLLWNSKLEQHGSLFGNLSYFTTIVHRN